MIILETLHDKLKAFNKEAVDNLLLDRKLLFLMFFETAFMYIIYLNYYELIKFSIWRSWKYLLILAIHIPFHLIINVAMISARLVRLLWKLMMQSRLQFRL